MQPFCQQDLDLIGETRASDITHYRERLNRKITLSPFNGFHTRIQLFQLFAHFLLEITDEKLYYLNHPKEVMSTTKSQIFHITQLPNRSSSVYEQYSVHDHKF